eukprot:514919-Pleurochrysis_carterae.AAC.2
MSNQKVSAPASIALAASGPLSCSGSGVCPRSSESQLWLVHSRCAVCCASVCCATICMRNAACGSPTICASITTNSSNISVRPTRSNAFHMKRSALSCAPVSAGMCGPSWQVRPSASRDWQSGGLDQKQSGTRWLTKWKCHDRCCSSGWRSSVTRWQRQPAARRCCRSMSRSGSVYLRK